MLNTSFSVWPSFSQKEADAVSRVVLSNKTNYWTGLECRDFEKEFSVWAGTQSASCVSSVHSSETDVFSEKVFDYRNCRRVTRLFNSIFVGDASLMLPINPILLDGKTQKPSDALAYSLADTSVTH